MKAPYQTALEPTCSMWTLHDYIHSSALSSHVKRDDNMIAWSQVSRKADTVQCSAVTRHALGL